MGICELIIIDHSLFIGTSVVHSLTKFINKYILVAG